MITIRPKWVRALASRRERLSGASGGCCISLSIVLLLASYQSFAQRAIPLDLTAGRRTLALSASVQRLPSKQGDFDKMVQEIKALPSQTIFQVSGTVTVKDSVIKADKVIFADGARLVFNNVSAPYFALVAKEIIFSAPSYQATLLRRPDAYASRGPDGITPSGRPTKKPKRPNGGNGGYDGDQGYPGASGGVGATVNTPPVFIFADKVTRQAGGTSNFIDFRLLVSGVDGGDGGTGGNGGRGGDGGDGGNGVSGLFDCQGGPGDGGRGGAGGVGGRGGNGAAGGNGSDVYYVGSPSALDELEVTRVFNLGGFGGRGGYPGHPGIGGDGGARGSRSGWCNGGSDGGSGPSPTPPDLGRGSDSTTEGLKGSIYRVPFDVNKLF